MGDAEKMSFKSNWRTATEYSNTLVVHTRNYQPIIGIGRLSASLLIIGFGHLTIGIGLLSASAVYLF